MVCLAEMGEEGGFFVSHFCKFCELYLKLFHTYTNFIRHPHQPPYKTSAHQDQP